MFDLEAIQRALQEASLDGWLLYDFRGSNPLARRVLELEESAISTRRFYYWIPARGEPVQIVHRIESGALSHLPGERRVYLPWSQLEQRLGEVLAGCSRIAMEYSPRCGNPYVARVDAGTVELVRDLGPEVVSSGDLIQQFEAVLSDEQIEQHFAAAEVTHAAFERVWAFLRERLGSGGSSTEMEVQNLIMEHFAEHDCQTYHPPIVGVGPHSGVSHYEPSIENDTPIQRGDFLLVDLWAKKNGPAGVYSDLTRVVFLDDETPAEYEQVFQIVARARDAAIAAVRDAFADQRPIHGWEADDACRAVIEDAGYGEYFVHRTGHSIGRETHGNGANIDNLETRDQRRLLPRTCFSIEPGIYMEKFGVRSEVNVLIQPDGRVEVTGGEVQDHVPALLAEK